MKKEIPVRFIEPTKENIDIVSKEIWKWKDNKKEENTTKSEEIRTIDTDIKTVVLIILTIVLLAFIWWWFMNDRWLQDWINNIKELKKDNVISKKIIDKETKNIQNRDQEIENTKEKIKKDYNITVE